MPNPVPTITAIQFLWKESKPVRSWIWGKLPMVRDAKKRDTVEGLLAKLLDDANKLAQAVPADEVDARLGERLTLFRKDIETEGIKGGEADAFMERAALLARLMVTGPLGNVIDLRGRLAVLESALEETEKSVAEHERTIENLTTHVQIQERKLATLMIVTVVAATLGSLSLIVALTAFLGRK